MKPTTITAKLAGSALESQKGNRSFRALDSNEISRYKWLFVKCAQDICPGWKVAPEHSEAINAIFRWCMELEGSLDCNKGLCLYGNNGTGKTTLLHIVRRFCEKIGKRDSSGNLYSFRISAVSEISGAFMKSGESGLETYIRSDRQAFDDLGTESIPSMHFGTQLNVMQYILQCRYDKRFTSFTHMTMNLDIDQISDLYGERIYDRCKEMFNFVKFVGDSFRGDFIKT